MRPGCCSRVGSAEEHQPLLGAQSRVSAAFPRLCALHGPAARPAPPARGAPPLPVSRPPPARLPQSKPAAPAGTAACRALPRVSTPQSWQRRAASASPTPPDPARPTRATAPGGAPRGTLGVVVRAAQPRRAAEAPGAVEEAGGLCLDPDPQSLGVRTWGRAPPPHRWRRIWSPRPDPSRVQQRPGAT